MKHLTLKNLILAFLAMQLMSVVMLPDVARDLSAAMPESSTGTFKHVSNDIAAPRAAGWQAKRPPVVKVKELPDIDALLYGENAYVDLGWRYAGESGGEWVGYIGSDTEYLPLDDAKIEAILKQTNMKALPMAPVPQAVTNLKSVKPSEPASQSEGLTGVIYLLFGLALALYVRYRITQAAAGLAVDAFGQLKRAIEPFFKTPAQPSRAPQQVRAIPVSTGAPKQTATPPRRNTVVRASRNPFFSGL